MKRRQGKNSRKNYEKLRRLRNRQKISAHRDLNNHNFNNSQEVHQDLNNHDFSNSQEVHRDLNNHDFNNSQEVQECSAWSIDFGQKYYFNVGLPILSWDEVNNEVFDKTFTRKEIPQNPAVLKQEIDIKDEINDLHEQLKQKEKELEILYRETIRPKNHIFITEVGEKMEYLIKLETVTNVLEDLNKFNLILIDETQMFPHNNCWVSSMDQQFLHALRLKKTKNYIIMEKKIKTISGIGT